MGGYRIKNEAIRTRSKMPRKIADMTAQAVAAVYVCERLKGMLDSSTGRNSERMAATETANRKMWRCLTAA